MDLPNYSQERCTDAIFTDLHVAELYVAVALLHNYRRYALPSSCVCPIGLVSRFAQERDQWAFFLSCLTGIQ